MDNFNLSNLISKFTYKNVQVNKSQNLNVQSSVSQTSSSQVSSSSSSESLSGSTAQSLQMGSLAGTETSAYVKDLLKLPNNLNEFIYMVQRGYNQADMNRLLSQQSALQKSNLLSPTQAQILAQLQGLSTSELSAMLTGQLTLSGMNNLKNLQILAGGMVSLSELSVMLQANGKDAVTKLILTMATASKQGITDLSQLKDTAKLINASIACASQGNSVQTLKTLILLYLPWLPLQEGTDFELEIKSDPDNAENISILVITITTVNFGKIIATLVLETSNSVHVSIECSKNFPKDELMLRIEKEEKHYSMQSVVSFQPLEVKSSGQGAANASVTMSSMDKINPFLLLMSHTIIRNIILIDNETSNGIVTHTDT